MELDDGILDHPKFIRAVKTGGGDAVLLWLGLRAHCAKLLTDGFVPDDMIDEVRGPKDPRKRAAALQVLLDVLLLDSVSGGVQLHNYLKWSKSRAQVLAQREAARTRQTKFRGGHTVADDSGHALRAGVSHAVTVGVTNASVTPLVTVPSPLLSSPLHSKPEESSARAPVEPEIQEPDPKLTICPLNLTETASKVGIVAEFCEKYRIQPEQVRDVVREFVSYWTIGGGQGRQHANWPRKLREHIRRACEKPGGIKPIGELEHENNGGNGKSRELRQELAAGAAAMALMRAANAAAEARDGGK